MILMAVVALLLVTFSVSLQRQVSQQRVAGAVIKATLSPNKVHAPRRQATQGTNPGASAMLYVQGTQVLDGSGKAVLLRGAQIESPFNYIKGWQSGTKPSNYLNSAVFNTMVQQWKMNVLRLPISNWIYASDPVTYLNLLDQVIQQANTAGLYVVLDLHDNSKSGSPYGDNADLPKLENVAFWHTIAAHYKNNPMVMFDLFNEPKTVGWSTWLNGGGTMDGAQVVGFQNLINAVRSAGAKQIIIVEPGTAGGNSADDKGWATVDSNLPDDPNIVYSLHTYQGITMSPQQLDANWGPILNHHPIFYGEWALLPNANETAHCKNIVPSQADQDVRNFLNYMTSRHASWVAWEFTPYHLIQDYTSFNPTTLDIPWTCGDTKSHAGMGTIVKQFLTNN